MPVFSGLRARLLWLVLLTVLPALGLILYTGIEQRRLAAAATQGEAMRMVQFVSGTQRDLFAETQRRLQVLAQLPAVREGSATACSALLTRLHKQDPAPRYSSFFATRPNGDVFCSSVPLKSRVNAGNQAYYRRAMRSRAFAIGDYQIGRITGRAIIVLAQPVLDAAGEVQAIVGAGIDLGWLNRLAAEAKLPVGSTLTLVDHAGNVLARDPDGEKWIGRSLAGTPLLAAMHAQHEGVFKTAGLDDVPRLYAFIAIYESHQEGHVHVSVGIPAATVFAEADRILTRNLITLALVVLLMLGVAWTGGDVFVLRNIRALVAAARRLGGGDLDTRTGLAHGRDEIGQLAGAFDEMATALHARNTEFERVMEMLGDSEERFRTLVETTSDWIWEVDAHSVYTYASPKVSELLGYAPEEVVGKTPFDFMPPDEAEKIRVQFANIAAARRPFERLENVNLRKDGRRVVIETSGVPIFDHEGKLAGYRGVDRDITERVKAHAKLQYLAYHDELTDLPNRALLLDRLRQGLIETARHDRGVAAMCLDLRDFKNVNDTLGHEIGNHLLQAVAERLLTCVRAGDTVARLSGDKFGLMLADVSHHEDVTRVMQNIRAAFARSLRVDDQELHLSMTFGISLYPTDGVDAETLLKNADIAMYRARERDEDYQYYSADMTASATERLALENDLRRALERNELILHYQPQVDLASGAITGVEALIRWQHPAHGMISPEKFIPLAEQTGLILPIGEWVLRQACAQASTWQAAGRPLRVAVNLSARQFRQPGLDNLIRGILEKTGLDPGRLDVELTESIIVHDPAAVTAILASIEKLGVQISIDDFGTGYSSLSYLKRFSINVLKIDQSFVHDCTSDADGAAIVQAIITMAHALGIQTIAEGVETKEQLEFLRRNGCDAMQGYYFSRPVSAEEIVRLLREKRRLDL